MQVSGKRSSHPPFLPTLRILLGMSFSEAGNSNEEKKTERILIEVDVCFGLALA